MSTPAPAPAALLLQSAAPARAAVAPRHAEPQPVGHACPACLAAQTRAHSPLFRAHCHGCKVRALAQGPQFWRSMKEGAHTLAYQGELAAVFGDAGAAAGHAVVLAEHQRLKALQSRRGNDGSTNDTTTTTTHQGRPC